METGLEFAATRIMNGDDTSLLGGPRPFPQTSWNLIRGGQDVEGPAYRASLETLYRKYWGPVYFYIRRNWSRDVESAKDLTQAFFVAFYEKDFLRGLDADKGRFRNFVCAALRHFLSKEKRAREARKRSPEGRLLSLVELGADESDFDVPGDPSDDPEVRFLEDWKRALVNAAVEELRERGRRLDKTAIVEAFLAYRIDREPDRKMTYEDLAACFGLTVNQVTNGLHWARREFEAAFRQELREVVASDEDLRAEARELFGMSL